MHIQYQTHKKKNWLMHLVSLNSLLEKLIVPQKSQILE